MRLVIGGHAQGKLSYVLSQYPNALVVDENNWNEIACDNKQDQNVCVINHLHLIVEQLLESQDINMVKESMQELNAKIADLAIGFDQLVLISDEVGNGIVPLKKEHRIWREELGRLLCDLAAKADQVERVICQIPQKLK